MNEATPAIVVKIQPHIARHEKNRGLKLARVAANAKAIDTNRAITSTQTKKTVGMIGVIPKVPECNAGYSSKAKTINRKLSLKLTLPSAIAALLFIIILYRKSKTKPLALNQTEKRLVPLPELNLNWASTT